MVYEVLLFNSRLKLFASKLKSKWSNNFVVVNAYPSGSIKLEDYEKRRFMMNGQRLKHFYMGRPGESKVERTICFTMITKALLGRKPIVIFCQLTFV